MLEERWNECIILEGEYVEFIKINAFLPPHPLVIDTPFSGNKDGKNSKLSQHFEKTVI